MKAPGFESRQPGPGACTFNHNVNPPWPWTMKQMKLWVIHERSILFKFSWGKTLILCQNKTCRTTTVYLAWADLQFTRLFSQYLSSSFTRQALCEQWGVSSRQGLQGVLMGKADNSAGGSSLAVWEVLDQVTCWGTLGRAGALGYVWWGWVKEDFLEGAAFKLRLLWNIGQESLRCSELSKVLNDEVVKQWNICHSFIHTQSGLIFVPSSYS